MLLVVVVVVGGGVVVVVLTALMLLQPQLHTLGCLRSMVVEKAIPVVQNVSVLEL